MDQKNPLPTPCRRARGIRGLLLVLGPATLADAPVDALSWWLPYPWLVAALLSLSLVWAALGLRLPGGRWSRALATVGFLLWVLGTLLQHSDNPVRGLFVLLGAVSFLACVWPAERLRRYEAALSPESAEQELLLACGAAIVFGLDLWQLGVEAWPEVAAVAMSVAYLVPVFMMRHRGPQLVRLIAGLAGLAPLGVFLFALSATELIALGLLAPLLILLLVARLTVISWFAPQTYPAEPGLLDTVLVHPSRVLVLSFLLICALGTLLLGLPVSTRGEEISWFDAAFTAVSATCVTGLVVVDTPGAFGVFGQLVVMVLIQVGGLGIMVFSAAAIVLLGKRMSLSHEGAAVDIVGASGRSGLNQTIRVVLLVTLVTEAATALLLFIGFLLEGDSVGMAAWRALFTAISAFCNAGFALQSDSLISYAHNPLIIWTVGISILLGGLGPTVIAAILAWRQPKQRTLHVRLVLWTTAIMVVAPALVFGGLEWSSTLGEMSAPNKITNAIFQSISFRTAGFNSIDPTQMRLALWPLVIVMMFIGGSPGSIAGGVKTTTVAVLLLSIVSVVRGQDRLDIFGRTIPAATLVRAAVTTTLAILSCVVALTAVLLTQSIPMDIALFEVVSALATVGLSQGGTAMLDEIGKIIIITCMFTGRVGPLTLFVFLTSNTKERPSYRYPEETIPIG